MNDATRRFTDRVADYVRCRPGYPRELLTALEEIGALAAGSVVADLGSGTGILTRMLLEHGNRVFAVEPNRAMREAAEAALSEHPGFVSVNATAEATTLGRASVDSVAAAQAFHWFDQAKVKPEVARILRPGGWVILVWNDRDTESTPFLRDYEALLRRHAIDYAAVDHKRFDANVLARFFHPRPMIARSLAMAQTFDLEGLKGRCLSASYMPNAGHPGHPGLMRELEELFESRAKGGRVTLGYRTLLYGARWS